MIPQCTLWNRLSDENFKEIYKFKKIHNGRTIFQEILTTTNEMFHFKDNYHRTKNLVWKSPPTTKETLQNMVVVVVVVVMVVIMIIRMIKKVTATNFFKPLKTVSMTFFILALKKMSLS